jgi:hypothetical protein
MSTNARKRAGADRASKSELADGAMDLDVRALRGASGNNLCPIQISSYLIRQPAGGKVPGGDEAAVYEEEYAY